MNNLVKDLNFFDFQSHFSVLKIGQIFLKKKFYEEYLISQPTLIFKVLYFLKMCPIFVGSVHNFGKSEAKKSLFPIDA